MHKEAQDAEDAVQRALAFDEMEVDYAGDEDALASKAFMDNREAEAHANTILAGLRPTKPRRRPGTHAGSQTDGPLRE